MIEVSVQWEPGFTLAEMERLTIIAALAFHKGNKTHTARALEISIRTLRNKLEEYRIMEEAAMPPSKS